MTKVMGFLAVFIVNHMSDNSGKEYHACSSCGLDYNWEYYYCSLACWRQSKAYNDLINLRDT